MSDKINKTQNDIENLFKQNENDLSSIKEIYRRLTELKEKIIQIKYIDNTLANKLKKEYESLKRIILDENVQLQLNNKIDEINTELNDRIDENNTEINDRIDENNTELNDRIDEINTELNEVSSQLDNKANKSDVRLKNTNITLNDCDNSMLEAIQGGEGTTFELLSIPREKSVGLSQLNNIILGRSFDVYDTNSTWLSIEFIKLVNPITEPCILRIMFTGTTKNTITNGRVTTNQYQSPSIKFTTHKNIESDIDVTLNVISNNSLSIIKLSTNNSNIDSLDGSYKDVKVFVDGVEVEWELPNQDYIIDTTEEISELATKKYLKNYLDNVNLSNNVVKLNSLNNDIFGKTFRFNGVVGSYLSATIAVLDKSYTSGAVRVRFDFYAKYTGEIFINTNQHQGISEKVNVIKGLKNTIDCTLNATDSFSEIIIGINTSNNVSLDGLYENLIVEIDNKAIDITLKEPAIGSLTEITTKDVLATRTYVNNSIKEILNGSKFKDEFTLPFVNNLYVVQGSKRKHSIPIFIDYLYDGSKNKILFENGEDRLYIREAVLSPNSQTASIINTKETLKFKSETLDVPNVTFNKISIEEKTPNGKIRLLIIGDSVTAGAITEKQYWAVARELFALEDIDLKRNSDVMFLGSNNVRNTTINYNGVEKQVKSCACGISSWSLTNWLTSSSSHFVYDNNGTPTFSILKWIERYRTHLDDGTKLELGDSRLGTEITSSNIDNIQCCTPNIVYINSTHNGGSIEQHEQMIEIIKNEIPNCKIIVGNPMPLIGTWHKEKYVGKDWMDDINISGPNYSWGGDYGTSRITSLNYYTQRERENNDNTFYFMPQCVTMPTVESLEYDLVDCGVKMMKQLSKINQLPKEHPGTLTHKIWGYELYALLKYISGVEQGATNNFDTVPLFD